MSLSENLTEEPQRRTSSRRWIIFVSALLVTMLNFSFLLSLGAIFDEILAKFRTSRLSVAFVQSLLASIPVFGTIVGLLIPRYGVRPLSVIGSILTSAGLIASFFAEAVWHLYITCSIVAGLGITTVHMCFTVSIGYVFSGRAKFNALALQYGCLGVGAVLYPYGLRFLAATFGVNGTFLIVGGLCLNNFAALIILPAKLGLQTNVDCLENDLIQPRKNEQTAVSKVRHMYALVKDQLVTIVTVPYILTFFAIGIGQSMTVGYLVTYIDIYVWKHFTADQGTGSIIVFQICTVAVRLMSGVLMQIKIMDSIATPFVTSICGCFGVVAMYFSQTLALVYLGSGLIGIADGGFIAGSVIITADLVPQDSFGFAFGLMSSSIAILAAGTGPLYGFIRDTAGSYVPVLLLMGLSYVLSAVLFIIALLHRRCHVPKDKSSNTTSVDLREEETNRRLLEQNRDDSHYTDKG